MPPLLRLPEELILRIGHHLGDQDISHLLITSHLLSVLLSPILLERTLSALGARPRRSKQSNAYDIQTTALFTENTLPKPPRQPYCLPYFCMIDNAARQPASVICLRQLELQRSRRRSRNAGQTRLHLPGQQPMARAPQPRRDREVRR